MKTFGFSVLFLVMGITAFLTFICFSTGDFTILICQLTLACANGMSFKCQNNDMTMTIKNRKLQGNGYGPSINEDDSSKLGLEDYRPIDPVPSSKASVKPGPIEHGTPFMPYIPKPSPPPIGTNDGFP